MTEDEAYKVHIQYTFNAFCKVVIRQANPHRGDWPVLPPLLPASGGAGLHCLEKISDLFQGGGAVSSDRAGENCG